MAYAATIATYIGQAVAGEEMTEGQAVCLSASGVYQDLPVAMKADNTSLNVYVAIVPPDNYSRPTPMGMYINHYVGTAYPEDASAITPGTAYPSGTPEMSNLLTPISYSMLENPTIYSGMAVQIHRGVTAVVPDTLFASTPAQGADLYVGSDGKWATSGTNVVGSVREVRGSNVTIILN